MSMRNMAVESRGGLVVAVHNDRPPSDTEWQEYVAVMRKMAEVCEGDVGRVRQLVFTDGGSPSSSQREAIDVATREFGNRNRSPAAVVTDSLVVRGVVRIFSWFNVRIRAFAPAQLEDALKFLELSPVQREGLPRLVQRLAAQVQGSVRSAARLDARAD